MSNAQPSSLPSPAIVTEAAVRTFPRWLLWLLCVVYIGAGYIGRGPWKNEDVTSLGVMLQLANGTTASWWQPSLFGHPLDNGALLPYWLGAWFIQLGSSWLDPALAARLPFMAALGLVLYLTWHTTFQLALLPHAQPVAFAFGGQAAPVDYARTLADSSLMALMACLGLAQLSHETSPAIFQLLSVTALLYASSLSARGRQQNGRLLMMWWLSGLAGLSLSGRPLSAIMVAIALPCVHLIWANYLPQSMRDLPTSPNFSAPTAPAIFYRLPRWAWIGVLTVLSLAALQTIMAPSNGLCRDCDWAIPVSTSFGKLLLWFTWPVWPLVLWTLWQWRRHLLLHHISIPLAFSVGLLGLSALQDSGNDRVLMLALPSLACLAAFALPTLRRSVSSLIDWFSLLFFSGCAALIWIIWLAMVTGIPTKPAANVARLVPGFIPNFEWLGFLTAFFAALIWGYVLKWRMSHAPAVLWKSLILPATGGMFCWLLLMTLWLPLLNHSRSYAFLNQRLQQYVDQTPCLVMHKLSPAQQAGLLYHSRFVLYVTTSTATPSVLNTCGYGLTPVGTAPPSDGYEWQPIYKIYRLTDNKEGLQLYKIHQK